MGGLEQGQVQRNLDLAEADRREQLAYPQEQVDALTKTLAGVQPAVPKSQLVQGYGSPGSQTDAINSPLAQAGSTAAGLAALIRELGL
jgi:hypothetical protein